MTVTMRYLLITLCHNIIIIIMIMIYSYLLKIYIILSSNTIIYFFFIFFSLCQIMSKSHKIISSRNPMVHFITWHYRQVFFVILDISHFNNNFMLFQNFIFYFTLTKIGSQNFLKKRAKKRWGYKFFFFQICQSNCRLYIIICTNIFYFLTLFFFFTIWISNTT